MKHIICGLVAFVLLLNGHIFAMAEKDVLTIAVLKPSDALNLPAEEAFFKRHPNTVIEYHLFTQEQLNTMLLTGTPDFDLAILPYPILLNMAKKGHLASINQVLEQEDYPIQLIDISGLLTLDDWVFALPVSIAQPFWIWDQNIADRAGVTIPEEDAWTWEDYAQYAKEFPQDTDGDGKDDTYFMYGSCLPAYPAFHNVNLNMFEQYTAQYEDFETFGNEYLELFRENITGEALLDMQNNSDAASEALLQEASASNPICLLSNLYSNDQFIFTDEQAGYRFLPPPILDRNNVSYLGSMSACGILKQAGRYDLASDFLRGMVSEDTVEYSTFNAEEQFVTKNAPKYMYFDEIGDLMPEFMNHGNALVYQVAAGRNIRVISFCYSQAAFEKAQAFREKLSVPVFLMGRDFYDSAWSYFQEWYNGRINDAELIRNMQYLFGIAKGIR